MGIRKTGSATGAVLGTEGPLSKTAAAQSPWNEEDEDALAAENEADQDLGVPDPEYDDFLYRRLDPADIRHYRRFLGSALPLPPPPVQEEGWRWRATAGPPSAPRDYGRWPSRHDRSPAELESARLRPLMLVPFGIGPDRCSSSQQVAVRVQWCWDVCGYYRR